MTYEQVVLAFALGHLPILIGAGFVLAVGARRWRDDRAVAALLFVAGVLLILRFAAEWPVEGVGAWFGAYSANPLWDEFCPAPWKGAVWWTLFALLPASAACGLTAVFLRRAPAPAPGWKTGEG